MGKASNMESGPYRALFSGDMDVEGMEEILQLYRDLFPLSGQALKPAREYRMPTGEEVSMRLEEGFTLLQPEDLMPSTEEVYRTAIEVMGILSRHSDREEAMGMLAEEVKREEFLPSLVALYLRGGEESLRAEIGSDPRVDPELCLFLIFNIVKGSFRENGRVLAEVSLTPWEKETCPVCGGVPAVAYLSGEEGQRHLVCHRCEARWRFTRIQCPFCGNRDHETLGYFTLEGGDPILRVDFCEECGKYIKSWDVRQREDLLPEYEDLKSISYDMAAEEEGYRRGAPNIFGVWVNFGRPGDENAEADREA
ncbi:MAG: formate dehydrogenase accessory protein FdhE [bacterium]|nr:MAG: formate dehydrogenase accessory protein FdhE [bacterium]